MGMIKHSQRNQSNKFAISLQYLNKEVSHKYFLLKYNNQNAFLFYCDVKNSDTLQQSSHVCGYLFKI